MAARYFQQFQGVLEKGVVTLYANIPIGASGAVGTLTNSQNQGILSVVRNSAGNYTISFGNSAQGSIDKYVRLLDFSASVLLSSISVVSDIQVFNDNSSSGNIIIQVVAPTATANTAGAATDPDNGAVILLAITLKNASI